MAFTHRTILTLIPLLYFPFMFMAVTGCNSDSDEGLGALNTNLKALTISSCTLAPDFHPSKNNYTTSEVNINVNSVSISATPEDPNATVSINGLSSSETVNIFAGVTNIKIQVTAQNRISKSTYTIAVSKDPGTKLQTITVSEGRLSPAFAPDISAYSLTVNNSTDTMLISPVVQTEGATVSVRGNPASDRIPLSVGANQIPVVVTSPDGGFNRTYSINAIRQNPVGTVDWTVMVYLDGDNDLESYAIDDFNEMERGVARAISSDNTNINENLNIIVMFDRSAGYNASPTENYGTNWSDTRCYRILPDASTGSYFNSERLDDNDLTLNGHTPYLGEKNMGDPATLAGFLSYCRSNFPATRYALVLWDHGDGARAAFPGTDPVRSSLKGVCSDTDNGEDMLYLDEIQQAVSTGMGAETLDIIGFDACLMGTVEVAYEFRDLADYMVGSMYTLQGDGWDYEDIFGHMNPNHQGFDEQTLSAVNFATLIVDSYQRFISSDQSLSGWGETMTAVDLSRIGSLIPRITTLAQTLAGHQTDAEAARDRSVYFYDIPGDAFYYPYYDLYDLCTGLYDTSSSTLVKDAAGDVQIALNNAVIKSFIDSGNGFDSPYTGSGKGGLSIFFTQNSSDYQTQWWYTDMDTNTWEPGFNYGNIDFCYSDSNGSVESWRELMEYWYDPNDRYTPGTF